MNFNIRCERKIAIKSQILANYVAISTNNFFQQEVHNAITKNLARTLYVDGSSNAKGSNTRIIIKSPKDDVNEQLLQLKLKPTNNEAKYNALIASLILAKQFNVNNIQVYKNFHG